MIRNIITKYFISLKTSVPFKTKILPGYKSIFSVQNRQFFKFSTFYIRNVPLSNTTYSTKRNYSNGPELEKIEAIKGIQNLLRENPNDEIRYEVSNKLREASLFKECAEILAPIYDPQKHNFLIGINLLYSYLKMGDIENGRKLYEKMRKINPTSDEERLLIFYLNKLETADFVDFMQQIEKRILCSVYLTLMS